MSVSPDLSRLLTSLLEKKKPIKKPAKLQTPQQKPGAGMILPDQENVERQARLLEHGWVNVARLLLMRHVLCTGCQTEFCAPNEHIMLRREHKRYGVHENALSPHDPSWDHLPLRVENLSSVISQCPYCLNRGVLHIEPAPITVNKFPILVQQQAG